MEECELWESALVWALIRKGMSVLPGLSSPEAPASSIHSFGIILVLVYLPSFSLIC